MCMKVRGLLCGVSSLFLTQVLGTERCHTYMASVFTHGVILLAPEALFSELLPGQDCISQPHLAFCQAESEAAC